MGEAPRKIGLFSTSEKLHEESDAQIRPLAMFLGGLAVSLVIVVGIVWLFFDVLLATVNNAPAERPSNGWADQQKEPRLQPSPRSDLEVMRRAEDEKLQATEWINAQHARIPIESAIEIVANKGLPKWPAAAPQSANAGSDAASGARPDETRARTEK